MLVSNSSSNLVGSSIVAKMSALQKAAAAAAAAASARSSTSSPGSIGTSTNSIISGIEITSTVLMNSTLRTLYNDSGGSTGTPSSVSTADYFWNGLEGYNDTLYMINGENDSLSINSSHLDSGGNESNALAEKRIYCTEWPGATLTLFQVANFFCLLAFVVPHNFRLSALVMRIVLCVGILLFTLWAGLDICAPDIFAWNLSFLVVNAAHVLHLTYTVWPPKVPEDLADLYAKVFKPLKVNHKYFCHLIREATVLWLEPGETYAVEDITPADERLSILVSGKLRVTCDSTHLHYILPTQFIDSPEWESCADDSDQAFQVTIVAEERSKYLCWSRPRLRHVLHLRPFLRAVIHNLIGKDITTKLYSLNEQLGVSGLTSEGVRGIGAQDVWRGVVQRSMSVDNVHTGTKGFVRSLAWRASHRRTSATYCESVNAKDPELDVPPCQL